MFNHKNLSIMFDEYPVKIKVRILMTLNKVILEDVGDDNITDIWFSEGIPDEPSEDDYYFIATNRENFIDVCNLFDNLTQGKFY